MVKTSSRYVIPSKTPIKTPSKSALKIGAAKSSSKRPKIATTGGDSKLNSFLNNQKSHRGAYSYSNDVNAKPYVPRKPKSIEVNSSEIAKPVQATTTILDYKSKYLKSPLRPAKSPGKFSAVKSPARNRIIRNNDISRLVHNSSHLQVGPPPSGNLTHVPPISNYPVVSIDTKRQINKQQTMSSQFPSSSTTSTTEFGAHPKLAGNHSTNIISTTDHLSFNKDTQPMVEESKDIYSPEIILKHQDEYREVRRQEREAEHRIRIIMASSVFIFISSLILYRLGFRPFYLN